MQRMVASMRMIAKVPTLAAMAYKYSIGQPFVYPRNDLNYTSNFLRIVLRHTLRGLRGESVWRRALDRNIHSARRSGPGRLDLHRAPVGLLRRRSLRLHRRRIRFPLGPRARGRHEAVLENADRNRLSGSHPHYLARARTRAIRSGSWALATRIFKNTTRARKIMQSTTREVLGALDVKDPMLELRWS